MSVTPEQLAAGRAETHKHIGRVQYFLRLMIDELDKRSLKHDASKLESPEAEIYAEFGPQLDKVEYLSPGYRELLEKVQPALEHHYAKNRHHPQAWPQQKTALSQTIRDLLAKPLSEWDGVDKQMALEQLSQRAAEVESPISSMSWGDLGEMLADWRAATERNKNGNIRTSIEKNVPRFNISPQLAQIMQNTVRELFQD